MESLTLRPPPQLCASHPRAPSLAHELLPPGAILGVFISSRGTSGCGQGPGWSSYGPAQCQDRPAQLSEPNVSTS